MGINIAQKTNNFSMDSVKFGKVHGQTKIELYDVNKRIKKVYRDENVFQSAMIAKYMRSLGYAGARLSDYAYSNLLGGILIFRDTITEGSQYMPASNQMVGNGSYGVVNNSNPTEMGSFNSIESSESISAVTQVYDFTTSQANGTISCVCLTSKLGGYIGYGNPSGKFSGTIKDFYEGMSVNNLGGAHAFYDNKTFVITSYENGILTITKKHFPITISSIRNIMTETVTIDMTNYHLGNNTIGVKWQDGNAIYFTYYQSVAASGTLYYYKYNLDTDTVEEKTLVNSGTKSFYSSDINGGGHGTICVYTAGGGAYLFDMTTQALLKEFDFAPTTTAPLWNGLLGIHKSTGILWIYDKNTDRLFPTNGTRSPQWGTAYLSYDASCDVLRDAEYQDAVAIASNPLYLATINNLQTPVTKTAAQTMKITYTLTEEE